MTGSQASVLKDVNTVGQGTCVINNVSLAPMGRIVQADAALTVILHGDVTGLQATVPTDVKQDGQETRVINNVNKVITVEIVVRHAA